MTTPLNNINQITSAATTPVPANTSDPYLTPVSTKTGREEKYFALLDEVERLQRIIKNAHRVDSEEDLRSGYTVWCECAEAFPGVTFPGATKAEAKALHQVHVNAIINGDGVNT